MRLLGLACMAVACRSPAATKAAEPPSPCGPPVEQADVAHAQQMVQQPHAGTIRSLAFSDDGRLLATSSGAEIKIWDVRARALVKTLARPATEIAWDDRGHLAIVRADEEAITIDVATERVVGGFDPPIGHVLRVRSAATQWIGLLEHELVLYDANRRRIGNVALAETFDWKTYPSLSPDGGVLGVLGRDLERGAQGHQVARWRLDGGKATGLDPIALPHFWDEGFAMLPRGDGAVIDAMSRFVGSPNGLVVVAATGKIETLIPGRGSVSQLAVSRDGSRIAAVTSTGLEMFDARTRKRLWQQRALSQRLSVGTDIIATAPDPMSSGKLQTVDPTAVNLDTGFYAVTFSPGGQMLAAVGERIHLFDVARGRLQGVLGAELLEPSELHFIAPDELIVRSGQHVATWSLATAARVDQHTMTIPYLYALRPVGKQIVSIRSRGLVAGGGDAGCQNGAQLTADGWGGMHPPPELAGPLAATAPHAGPWPPTKIGDSSYCLPRNLLSERDRLDRATFHDGGTDVDAFDLETGRVVFKDINRRHPAEPDREFAHVVRTLSPERDVVLDEPANPLPTRRDFWFGGGGSLVASYEPAGGAQLYEADTGAQTGTFEGSPPTSEDWDGHVAISNDRAYVAVSDNAEVRIYKRNGTIDARVRTAADVSAISPVGTAGFLVGGADGGLARIDGVLRWRTTSAGGPIRAIAAAPDGSRAATISKDNTVRVFSLHTGELLATLLEFADDEWLVVTPGGAYTGTPEAAERLGWVFDAPLEYFRFEQFSASMRDPAAVARRLQSIDGGADPQRPMHRPPRVDLVRTPTTGSLALAFDSATRVDLVRVYAEGRPVASANVCKRHGTLNLDVPLAAGTNRLSIVAVDDRGYTSNAATADVVATAQARRPTLWIVAIGVDRYPHLDAKWQLGAAVADARAIADAFAGFAGPGKLFESARVTTLFDAGVTRPSVEQALDKLAQMQPEDVAIVFLAGHGWKDQASSDMVFVTGDVTAPTDAAKTGVGWNAIGERLRRARGRTIVLLDACHAGHVSQELVVPNGALATSLHQSGRAGVLVFAASKGRQLSYETHGARALARVADKRPVGATNHGVFTGEILAALVDPATDRDGDAVIQLAELVDAVSLRVVTASQGLQTPWIARRELFGDFGLATVARP